MESIATTRGEELDPIAAFSAFFRIGYSDLVTVIVTSVLTVLVSIPVVTLGAALLATIDTLTTVITAEGRESAPSSERDRLRYYVGSFREHLVRGIPYSVLLAAVGVSAASYTAIAFATGSTSFLLGAVVGLYAVVIVTVWSLRAMSATVRSEDPPPFRAAMKAGWYSLLAELSFTALHAIVAATLVVVALRVWIVIPLLLPGALVVLEIVAYEELHGDGAATLVLGYRGELLD